MVAHMSESETPYRRLIWRDSYNAPDSSSLELVVDWVNRTQRPRGPTCPITLGVILYRLFMGAGTRTRLIPEAGAET